VDFPTFLALLSLFFVFMACFPSLPLPLVHQVGLQMDYNLAFRGSICSDEDKVRGGGQLQLKL